MSLKCLNNRGLRPRIRDRRMFIKTPKGPQDSRTEYQRKGTKKGRKRGPKRSKVPEMTTTSGRWYKDVTLVVCDVRDGDVTSEVRR